MDALLGSLGRRLERPLEERLLGDFSWRLWWPLGKAFGAHLKAVF